MRLAVFASGEGTTLAAILEAARLRELHASVALVLSNNRESGALSKASAAGVPIAHMSRVTHPDPAALDQAMCAVLDAEMIDVIVLAGYMRKIGPETLKQYGGLIINTHPSLLPKHGGHGMYGQRVHEAVLAAGDTESGVSVHLVDAQYDAGSVVAQEKVPVVEGETVGTLEAKIRALERRFLCKVLQDIAIGRVQLRPNPSLKRRPATAATVWPLQAE